MLQAVDTLKGWHERVWWTIVTGKRPLHKNTMNRSEVARSAIDLFKEWLLIGTHMTEGTIFATPVKLCALHHILGCSSFSHHTLKVSFVFLHHAAMFGCDYSGWPQVAVEFCNLNIDCFVFIHLGGNESLDNRVLSMSWPGRFSNIYTGPPNLSFSLRAWAISR